MLRDLQVWRWFILLVAWCGLGASLFLPAFEIHDNLLPFHHMPVIALPLIALAELFWRVHPHVVDAMSLLFGILFFAMSPLIMVLRTGSKPLSWIGIILSLGLLLPWWTMVSYSAYSPTGTQGPAHTEFKVDYGFYVYAISQTVAFVACLLPGKAAPKRRAAGGFIPPPVRSVDETADALRQMTRNS